MTLTGHHNFVLTALHGLGNGMFIEGCCRWGMDEVWYMNRYTLNDTLRLWIFGPDPPPEEEEQVVPEEEAEEGEEEAGEPNVGSSN